MEWAHLEKAVFQDKWTLQDDRQLRSQLQSLTDTILFKAENASTSIQNLVERTREKEVQIDMLINSFERISSVKFVENVSVVKIPYSSK